MWPGGVLSARIKVYWRARSRALLRHTAGSPEDDMVHRGRILERVVLLSGLSLPGSLLPCWCSVSFSSVLSVSSSTVAWYSGFCFSFSSSCFASCGEGGGES